MHCFITYLILSLINSKQLNYLFFSAYVDVGVNVDVVVVVVGGSETARKFA